MFRSSRITNPYMRGSSPIYIYIYGWGSNPMSGEDPDITLNPYPMTDLYVCHGNIYHQQKTVLSASIYHTWILWVYIYLYISIYLYLYIYIYGPASAAPPLPPPPRRGWVLSVGSYGSPSVPLWRPPPPVACGGGLWWWGVCIYDIYIYDIFKYIYIYDIFKYIYI